MSVHQASLLVEAGLWLRLCGDLRGAQHLFTRALEHEPSSRRTRELLDNIAERLKGLAEEPPASPSPGPAAARQAPAAPAPKAVEAPDSGPIPLPDSATVPASPPARSAWDDDVVPAPSPPPARSAWDEDDEVSVIVTDAPLDEGDPSDVLAYLAGEANAPALPTSSADHLRREVETLLQGVQDLLELDDHSSAMELLQRAESLAPGNSWVAAARERCERTLLSMFESKLGEPQRVPRVKLQPDEIIWLNLDHRAGFVLAQIDGVVSYDDLFALSGMPRLDTARILVQLLEEGVISAD